MTKGEVSRRSLVCAAAVLAAPTVACAQARPSMVVWRDPNCGCCSAWSAQMEARFEVAVRNVADLGAVKRRLGVPADLESCHTAEIGGFVLEGHLPMADVLRLLETAPEGVRGLAVPGMPLGSPGMETPDGAREAYQVIALHRDGSRSVFARYAAG